MTFSMKPASVPVPSPTGATDEEWKVWNTYFYGLLDTKEQPAKDKQGNIVQNRFYKKKKLVGILNLIVDCGTQPQPDASYEWKGVAGEGEQLSEAEQAHIAKYPDNYFRDVDGKRMQFKPERPTQEYAFYFDFPKVMVDWTKHPIEALHHLGKKPLRVCYNGYFKDNKHGVEGFARNLRFTPNYKTGKISPNNPIAKLAATMGRSEAFDKEYDFVELAGGACFFDLFITKTIHEEREFFNTEIRNYSEIVEMELPDESKFSVEQQIPECDTEFMGCLMNGMEYSDLLLDIVAHSKELMAVLPKSIAFQPNATKAPDFWLGVNWEDSDLCKALANKTSKAQQEQSSTKEGEVHKQDVNVVEGTTEKAEDSLSEGSLDLDEDIPF